MSIRFGILFALVFAFGYTACYQRDSTKSQGTAKKLASAKKVHDKVESRLAENPIPDRSIVKAGDYEVTLVQRAYDKEHDLDTYYGLQGYVTKRIVTAVEVKYKGEDQIAPMSCYCDLSNVGSFQIESTNDDAILTLEGGDAGDSFKCEIYLKEGQVMSRHVEDGEFPEYFNETTFYRNIEPGSDFE